jgi:Flp pilus assembly protein TadG
VCARSFAGDEDGATAVEFALVAPPFFALVFAIIQFGWAMNCAASVRHALVHEGRQIALNPTMTNSDLSTALGNDMAGVTNQSIATTLDHRTINGVSAAVASATYSSSIVVPLLGTFPISFTSNITVPLPQS